MHTTIYNVSDIETVVPTYLYIKRHYITGLRYFGKTCSDPYRYKGSGKIWKYHINKYGKEFIENELVIGPYTNKSQLENLALWMSDALDIVQSSDWANLIPENGTYGGNKGVPSRGRHAKGMPRAPMTGRRAKGMPQTGKSAKGMPRAGKTTKGMSMTGKGAKGIPKGPAVGRNAKGVLKGPQKLSTCKHRGKIGGISLIVRYHNDNCKHRDTSSTS